ncbi:hypothetical protein AGMMS50267_16310 [Spirochaetia bacterium]|nr:hypothetical protein AGMMS50267_16310 [Spirochaetia bacterium]
MSGNGRGGNSRRRPSKKQEHRAKDDWQGQSLLPGKKKSDKDIFRPDRNRGAMVNRPQWAPVKPPSTPIPAPDCPICAKPIRDISAAMTDKNSGLPAHFDCIIAKIAEKEVQDRGDVVAYIGGGRFGVVHYQNPQDTKNFKIKKIIEWEAKENRAGWRQPIADRFSTT